VNASCRNANIAHFWLDLIQLAHIYFDHHVWMVTGGW
jgi:hypothetical protein